MKLNHPAMDIPTSRRSFLVAALVIALTSSFLQHASAAATLQATYRFSNNLMADQPGVLALTPVDPLVQNGYIDETVYGVSDTVYRFSGTSAQNAGLSLNTTGLVTPNSYSLEMVFKFDDTSSYRRIMDVSDRGSDFGFYVIANKLAVYAFGGGTNDLVSGYNHIILTVAPDNTVKGYLNGTLDFTIGTAAMHLNNSPTNTMSLFLDNFAGGGGEYSSGNIAQLRLYNGVLTSDEALAFSLAPIVPEPSAIALFGTALIGWVARRRRNPLIHFVSGRIRL